MTRENKLALVVGFGLILFVGILISDHFSTVRTQTPANLTNSNYRQAIDPLASNQSERPSLIDLAPVREQPVAVNPGMIANTPVDPITDSPRPEHYNGVYPGGYPNSPQYVQQQPHSNEVRPINADGTPQSVPGFVQMPPQADPIPVNWKMHEVKSGESFFAICRQYYSDTNQVKALAKFNSIDDPASLRIGQKIRIPTLDELNGRTPSAKPAPGMTNPQTPSPTNTTPAPPSLRIINEAQIAKTSSSPTSTSTTPSITASGKAATYTVKAGDSLASIAQKFLGSRAKWRKLFDMNRQVVEDPDDVKVGTVLKLL